VLISPHTYLQRESGNIRSNILKRKVLKISVIVFAILFVLYVVIGFVGVNNILFKQAFARNDDNQMRELQALIYPIYEDFENTLPRKSIDFMSDENKLQGYIYGEENTKALAVVVHGFGGNSENYLPQINAFVENGYRVLSYDGTGVFESEGESRVNFYQASEDLRACIKYINADDSLNSLPLILYGHSQGGFAVCDVLNFKEAETVDYVISVAGLKEAGGIVESEAKNMIGGLYYAFKPFLMLLDKEDFNSKHNSVTGINKSNAKVMLIQGTEETTVTPDEYATTHFTKDIKNSNCEIVMVSEEWCNDHNNIIESENSFNYNQEFEEKYRQYLKDNNLKGDMNTYREYYSDNGYDRLKAHENNEILFEKILNFIEN
jgi:hypothetical protein